MKLNRSYMKFALVVFLTSVLAACTANYEDMNRDPFGPDREEIDRDGYPIISAMLTIQNNVVSTDVNTCQFTECLLGGPFGGYFADSNPSWNSGKISTYNAPNNWMRVMFQDIIPKLYTGLKELEKATDKPVPLAIGNVAKIAAMHRITDTYGPIPYKGIGKDGKIQVEYDSQQEIYNMFFDELDEAIETLTAHQTELISPNADKVFDGDVKKWIRYANSLKLRLAMRIVYADPETARRKAEEAVNHEVGVMADNSDNAALTMTGEKGNPILVAASYNKGTSTTGGDHHTSADITTYMNHYNDPRRAAYFLKSTFATNIYAGLRSGIPIPPAQVVFQYAGINLEYSSRLQWMNSAEVMFLMAEGALRGWNMGGDAKMLYENGIRLSFEQWGVSGFDNYVADNSSVPAGYEDPAGLFGYNSPLTDVAIAWNGGDFEKSLERIIIQKWIANWTLGNEAWADRRRTGYPKLMPVVMNGSGGVLANDDIPRRLPYPLEEYQTNNKNVTSAVSELLGGTDNIGTRLWWDQKN